MNGIKVRKGISFRYLLVLFLCGTLERGGVMVRRMSISAYIRRVIITIRNMP